MKKVKFNLPAQAVQNATEVLLVGDFNQWLLEKAIALTPNTDGDYEVEIELEPGSYQFKFYLNDGRWENSWNADEYYFDANNGVHNSVVHINEATSAKKEKTVKTTAKKEVPAKKETPAKKATKVVKAVVEKVEKAVQDDLTKVHGVTAKVSKVLTGAGIHSFADLGKQTAKKLKEVLVNADAKLASIDVATLTKQAKLAAAEKWAELEKLQKDLKAKK